MSKIKGDFPKDDEVWTERGELRIRLIVQISRSRPRRIVECQSIDGPNQKAPRSLIAEAQGSELTRCLR